MKKIYRLAVLINKAESIFANTGEYPQYSTLQLHNRLHSQFGVKAVEKVLCSLLELQNKWIAN
jgi:hypothetical protein